MKILTKLIHIMKRVFMRNSIVFILLIMLITVGFCFGQSPTKIVEDFKASSVIG